MTQTTIDMTAALVAGAQRSGANIKAAVHLLTFTDLPNHPRFAYALETGDGGAVILTDWNLLTSQSATLYMSFPDRRLLQIAASFAVGRQVDLREATNDLGLAHTRRLIEAVAIGSGLPELAGLQPWSFS